MHNIKVDEMANSETFFAILKTWMPQTRLSMYENYFVRELSVTKLSNNSHVWMTAVKFM